MNMNKFKTNSIIISNNGEVTWFVLIVDYVEQRYKIIHNQEAFWISWDDAHENFRSKY